MVDEIEQFNDAIAKWRQWFEAACQRDGVSLPLDSPWASSANQVWLASEFVRQHCVDHPRWLADLVESGHLYRPFTKRDFTYLYKQCLKSVDSMLALKKAARQFRQQMTMRMIWRDVAGWATLQEIIKETSDCADVVLDLSNKLLYRWLGQKRKAPPLIDHRPPYMIIIAVGKLGGEELNCSSDVDLIFSYMKPVNSGDDDEVFVFYRTLAQQLVDVLSDVNQDGFVYRVDLRLRPYGTSGALVMSERAMAQYYQHNAREWERYAMLKARVISSDPRHAKVIDQMMKAFVFRPYLDYSTVESLRRLHHVWSLEAKRQSLTDHLKMGVGGIREIEFIVQNIQLMRGGQEPRLRYARLLSMLAVIEQESLLPPDVVHDLERIYIFLRTIENRLQGYMDSQTHALPTDTQKRSRLALSMGFADWDGLAKQLSADRATVHHYFQKYIFRPESYEYSDAETHFQHVLSRCWNGHHERHLCEHYVRTLAYHEPAEVVNQLLALYKHAALSSVSEGTRQDVLKLLSMVVHKISGMDQCDRTLHSILPVLVVVAKQRAYLVLLLENLLAVDHLLRIAYACPWLCEQISVYPALIGELVDDERLFESMSLASLKRKLLMWLRPMRDGDETEQMRVIAHFKLCHLFKVAAMDVSGRLPIAQVSNYLSYIAEAILQYVLRLAWRHVRTTERGGKGLRIHPRCMMVAYGKLGGLELGYGSDLDLVFLYEKSDRQPPEDEQALYTKLVQKILALMRFQTVMGSMYTVDTRLRPRGESGLLVNRLETFKVYQQQEAWVWEHQALVRARVVAGPSDMRSTFYAMRKEVLGMPREPLALWEAVSQMRQKMLQAAQLPDASCIHLKKSKGCLNDIEFIVQYLVLCYASQHPSLVTFTDNIRLLEVIGRLGLIDYHEAKLLYDAFLAFRSSIHRLDLQKIPSHTVPSSQFRAYRAAVQNLWEKLSRKP